MPPAAEASPPFKLSVQLQGHTADVRAVAALSHVSSPARFVLSASRDNTARIWPRHTASGAAFETPLVLSGHQGFVNAATWMRKANELFALTAGQDKLVHAHQVQVTSDGSHVSSSPTPDFVLIGHGGNVCAVDAEADGDYIVTASWDLTAKVWKNWECVATLKGHKQSVWAVLAWDKQHVLTASADRLIRLFDISKPDAPLAIFSGHTDAVRGLVRLNEPGTFASCGNDAVINIYKVPDNPSKSPVSPTSSLSGHTSFVYSLAQLKTGEILSAGEDRSVRVWRGGRLVQTITIPAISVWSVAALDTDDFVCGSSDGWVRVFSRAAGRQASAQELQAYDSNVASQALNKAQVGDVRKETLPGRDELSQPGTKEGQVKMVRVGEGASALVEAYQWSMGKWEKVGEVVGGVGSGSKKLYEGREYDYVFDVDIADGVPPLKLPYNANEDPYAVAYRFLERNELPTTYVDQVVKFIEQNTSGVALGPQEAYVDPYSSGRYVPGSGGAGSQAAPHAAQTAGSAGLNVDPYTGSQSAAAPMGPDLLPQKTYLGFKTVKFDALKAKLAQLNSELQGTPAYLEPPTFEALNTQLSSLEQALGAKASSASAALDLSILEGALDRWPPSHRLPLLDAFRMAASLPAKAMSTIASQIAKTALDAAQLNQPWPAAGAAAEIKERDTNAMLALRAIANALGAEGGAQHLAEASNATLVLGTLRKGGIFKRLGKNGRIAFVTVLLNFSVHAVNAAGSESYARGLLDLLHTVLDDEPAESEVAFRALVALGNLLLSRSSGSLSVGDVARAKDSAQKAVRRVASALATGGSGGGGGSQEEQRLQKVAAEVARTSI